MKMYAGHCGLLIISELPFDKQRVDLENSNVEVKVNGFVASFSVELSYKNYSEEAVEVVYICPLDVKTAFYSFEAKLDGRTITAHCMEKKKAKDVYDKAVEEGHTAILGSEDRFSGDLIHLALGNLPKGEKADLKLKMVKELPLRVDGAVDFVLPTIFNPRYTPSDQPSGPDFPSPAMQSSVAPNKTPYSLHVKAEVEGSFKIAQIKSLSDAINVQLNYNDTSAKITQDGGTNFDHDWSFQIYYQSVHKPHCLQMAGDRTSTGLMKDDIIMINLFPEVPLEGYSPHNEIIFVVDRSGSMNGSKIVKAKTTLLLFLKSLPPGCRFNVVSFGSHFETLFECSSERYTESTLQKALELQRSMDADMGGTEIFSALRHVYSKEPIPGYPRQMIVLTDGEVWNHDQIFDLIQRHADETRVFAVGIGDGASTALVEGMARAGKGRHEMVAHEDQLQIRVMGLIGNMLQENVKDLTVECKVAPPQEVKLVPKIPPNVFGGQHLILYAKLKPNSKIESVKVGWKIGSEQFSCELKESDCRSVHDSNFSFHRLAAKAQLTQWLKEDDETVVEDVVNLSVSSSVVCKLTSFVGFDQDKKIIKERVKERHGMPIGHFYPPLYGGGYGSARSGPLLPTTQFGVPPAAPPPQSRCARTSNSQSGFSFGSSSSPQFSFSSPRSLSSSAYGAGDSNKILMKGSNEGAGFSFGSSARGGGSSSSLFGTSSNSHSQLFGMSSNSPGSQIQPSLNKKSKLFKKISLSGIFGSSDQNTGVVDSSSLVSNSDTEKDALIDIISNQQFDGFWTLQYCNSIMNLDENLCNSIQTKLSLSDKFLGTVLVLAYLELKFDERKEEWKLVSLKGRKFLETNNINPSDVIPKCLLEIKDKI